MTISMINLKYRVWHKLYKEYYEVLAINILHGVANIYNGSDVGDYDISELIIEQDTGLKVLHEGKIVSLFENDIVLYKDKPYYLKYYRWFAGYALVGLDEELTYIDIYEIKDETERNGLALTLKLVGNMNEKKSQGEIEEGEIVYVQPGV